MTVYTWKYSNWDTATWFGEVSGKIMVMPKYTVVDCNVQVSVPSKKTFARLLNSMWERRHKIFYQHGNWRLSDKFSTFSQTVNLTFTSVSCSDWTGWWSGYGVTCFTQTCFIHTLTVTAGIPLRESCSRVWHRILILFFLIYICPFQWQLVLHTTFNVLTKTNRWSGDTLRTPTSSGSTLEERQMLLFQDTNNGFLHIPVTHATAFIILTSSTPLYWV